MVLACDTLVIVNPTAAHGKVARHWPAVEQKLRAPGIVFEARLTERRGHATELAAAAAEAGVRRVIVYGGDGTLMEAANGLLRLPPRPPQAVLAIIPGGTGSDLVRTLGIPHDPDLACERLLSGSQRLIDVGLARFIGLDGQPGERYFVNIAGLGFDGEVVERLERRPDRKGGTVPYLLALLTTLVRYRNKDVTLHLDGTTVEGRFNSVVVANGKYFGGAMFVAPPADVQDGRFDVVVIGDMTRLEVVLNVPRLYKGTHLSHPKVSLHSARQAEIRSVQRMLLQADGDLIGMAPASLSIIPAALRVIA
jgi:diacylglycerol kinase (ATP)